jgi:hypothetical protein
MFSAPCPHVNYSLSRSLKCDTEKMVIFHGKYCHDNVINISVGLDFWRLEAYASGMNSKIKAKKSGPSVKHVCNVL